VVKTQLGFLDFYRSLDGGEGFIGISEPLLCMSQQC
jgi:hypothetical protein